MSIFGSKTKKEVAPKVKKTALTTKSKKVAEPRRMVTSLEFAGAILRPRITEKAGLVSEKFNAYTFEVEKDATKKTVGHAVEALYKVTPKKIAIVRLPSRKVFIRGKAGVQSGIKKAIVYLKKGDKIEFV